LSSIVNKKIYFCTNILVENFMQSKTTYIEKILETSRTYLDETFPNKERLNEFLLKIDYFFDNFKVLE